MDGKATKFLIFCVSILLFSLIAAHQKNGVDVPPEQHTATVSPRAVQVPRHSAESAYDPETVAVGEKIFSEAQATYSPSSTYIDVWGSGYPDAAAALFIPAKTWEGLSEEERDALVVFIQSQVPNIRSDPDKYITFAKGAKIHERLRTNIANMADGRYVIMSTIERNGNWINSGIVAEGNEAERYSSC